MSELRWTLKKEKFCQKYVENGGNGSAAYRYAYDTAGMKAETITNNAYMLLQNSDVSARVRRLEELQLKRYEVTQDRVVAEYSKLAFFDVRNLLNDDGGLKDISQLDDETAAAICGMDVEDLYEGKGKDRQKIGRVKKVKLADKKAALDSLAKVLAMFVERHEHTGKDGGAIEVKDMTPTEKARRIAFLLNGGAKKKE